MSFVTGLLVALAFLAAVVSLVPGMIPAYSAVTASDVKAADACGTCGEGVRYAAVVVPDGARPLAFAPLRKATAFLAIVFDRSEAGSRLTLHIEIDGRDEVTVREALRENMWTVRAGGSARAAVVIPRSESQSVDMLFIPVTGVHAGDRYRINPSEDSQERKVLTPATPAPLWPSGIVARVVLLVVVWLSFLVFGSQRSLLRSLYGVLLLSSIYVTGATVGRAADRSLTSFAWNKAYPVAVPIVLFALVITIALALSIAAHRWSMRRFARLTRPDPDGQLIPQWRIVGSVLGVIIVALALGVLSGWASLSFPGIGF